MKILKKLLKLLRFIAIMILVSAAMGLPPPDVKENFVEYEVKTELVESRREDDDESEGDEELER